MTIRKSIGRPPKVDYKVANRLADAIQHNANVSNACKYAGISRDTYYRYLKNEEVFAKKMIIAKNNQSKMIMSFLTTY